jgi:hypothetical protein
LHSHASLPVLFFTTALFLSGYAIQARTLRDLRAAIRPQARTAAPRIALPDRFRETTAELADGTVVVLESDAEREARRIDAYLRGEVLDEDPDGRRVLDVAGGRVLEGGQDVVVVRTSPGQEGPGAGAVAADGRGGEVKGQQQDQQQDQQQQDHHPLRAGPGDGVVLVDPDTYERVNVVDEDAPPKYISPAERRRLIKEELHKLAQGDKKVAYQRRVW